MMRTIRLVKTVGLILAGMFLLLVLAYGFTPTGRINAAISRTLESRGLSLAPAAHKTLLPGLAWKSVLLSSPQGPLISCDRLSVRPCLAPLLLGRVGLGITADIRSGRLDLKYGLNGPEALAVNSSGVDLSDIPFFKTALSARVSGKLWVKGQVLRGAKGLNGELRLEVKQLEFSGVKLGTFYLPEAANLLCRGMIRITDDRFRLESFSIQGNGVYMRLSGEIPNRADAMDTPINLTLEIMPKPDFWERQKTVFLLISKFMVSPGNYMIPIGGTLLKPEIF